jgi:hypothetical protein
MLECNYNCKLLAARVIQLRMIVWVLFAARSDSAGRPNIHGDNKKAVHIRRLK